jgi:hypothetical protein
MVDSLPVGELARKREILEVRVDDGREHYVVRWDDTGNETLFFPAPTPHLLPRWDSGGTGMKHEIELAEHIRGTYWHAAAILKLDVDSIIREPLDELRFEIGSGAITRRVESQVGAVVTEHANLRVPLHWAAAEHPNLFPVMDGALRISDVAGSQIELRLVGEYRIPMGAIGAVADALAGRRVAEKSLRGFLAEVAHRLQAKLSERVRVEK